jgi:membrane protein DedA with SNARE-associated domain
MRLVLITAFILSTGEMAQVEAWMQQAFYPSLLAILVVASLGVPIPEDIPLIAAGVLLRTHPGIASWPGTYTVALIGIVVGDLVLYSLGHLWGPGVVNHRSVRWMITQERFTRISRRFRVHGTWFCFFGRFVVGVRAAMCLTAGATRFPYWRFLLADLAGALLSVPLFVSLGYWFAGMIPALQAYVGGVQAIIFAGVAGLVVALALIYRARKRRPVKVRASPPDAGSSPPSAPGGPSVTLSRSEAPSAGSKVAERT